MVGSSMAGASTVSFLGTNYGLQVGHNYGSINAQFHLSPDDPNEAQSPVSTVPFDRDPDFLQRDSICQQVAYICSKPAARLALVGPGGIGLCTRRKSQIAIEHAYQTREKSPDTWVFWIHAGNSTRFELDYRVLADNLKIPARIDPNANIFKLVHDWLQDPKHGNWVLIVDNLDDDDFLRQVPSAGVPLSTFLPRCSHGWIIFTTRSHHIAERYVTAQNIVTVDADESHSVALLTRKLGIEQDFEEQDIIELVRALASVPLAIVQAAAYINKRAPRFTVAQYLEQFQKSDKNRVRMLEHEAGNIQRDWEAKSSILLTWQMSFDHIRKMKKSAADLLALMSFFDTEGISEILLRGSADESDDEGSSESDHGLDFEDDVQILREYSFISVNQDTKLLRMHGLVQTAVQNWVNACEDEELWRSQFIRNLLHVFPKGHPFSNWEKCRSLYPHVQRTLSHRPKSEESLRDWAFLLYRGAIYAQTSRKAQDSQELITKAKNELEKLLGPEHPNTLSSAIVQATGYSLEGRLRDAEETLSGLLKTCEKVLESDHHNIKEDPSKFRKGLAYLLEVLEATKKRFPEDHPNTLGAKGAISAAFIEQGKLKEAEEIELPLLKSFEKTLGEDHQRTVFSVVKLGTIYSNMGRQEEALPYGIKAVETYQRTLGERHPYTIGSMYNLTIIYGSLDRFQEAEPLAQAVFEAKRDSLGDRHPETVDAMEILAMVYEGLKRDKEASLLRWEVTKARVDAYRNKHRKRFSHNQLLSLGAKALVTALDRFQ
ncbi:hypothetical protein N7450_004177 [Penicillium hetheringtonii]|uniref:DUF7779 domain-containing protein n=1 Tax=Penicillium hetheringtonii TaxID=911720 RepID=A0AAD6GVI2_9EURO|nr:hypothetical protein N7450_004177 [Penicillium hetheringtonii]